MSPASLMNVGLRLGCSSTWKSRAVLEALASDNGLIEALLRREFAPMALSLEGHAMRQILSLALLLSLTLGGLAPHPHEDVRQLCPPGMMAALQGHPSRVTGPHCSAT